MGASFRPPRGAVLHPANEDQVGKLQSARTDDSAQHRAGQEAKGMPRVHRRPRDGPRDGTDPQRPFSGATGSIPAELAVPPAATESPAGSARRLGLLRAAE